MRRLASFPVVGQSDWLGWNCSIPVLYLTVSVGGTRGVMRACHGLGPDCSCASWKRNLPCMHQCSHTHVTSLPNANYTGLPNLSWHYLNNPEILVKFQEASIINSVNGPRFRRSLECSQSFCSDPPPPPPPVNLEMINMMLEVTGVRWPFGCHSNMVLNPKAPVFSRGRADYWIKSSWTCTCTHTCTLGKQKINISEERSSSQSHDVAVW